MKKSSAQYLRKYFKILQLFQVRLFEKADDVLPKIRRGDKGLFSWVVAWGRASVAKGKQPEFGTGHGPRKKPERRDSRGGSMGWGSRPLAGERAGGGICWSATRETTDIKSNSNCLGWPRTVP